MFKGTCILLTAFQDSKLAVSEKIDHHRNFTFQRPKICLNVNLTNLKLSKSQLSEFVRRVFEFRSIAKNIDVIENSLETVKDPVFLGLPRRTGDHDPLFLCQV